MNTSSERTAIVTGASSGIGRATAELLSRAGYTVFGTSRKIGLSPSQVSMLTCDVTNDESVSSLVSAVLAQTGRIDLLVNNAGIGLLGGAEEFSIPQVQALFDVNLFGVIRMTNAVLPTMRQRGQGRIINIGSILGLIPAPYSAHYSAVKHALEGYSESLDHEVRAFGVRVSVVAPGFVRTVFDQNGIEPDSLSKEYDEARAGFRALLADVMPKADLPEVVAAVVLKAANDACPRHRYTAGKAARQISILRRFAPAGVFDKSLRKQFRLPV
ncbi:oxidoreductase [Pseudomonas syringae]|uniref:SDR family NAD(P)-dependent oxidoreductase n=1 Tax=Pseudomonas syringae TaxID=317 RepID=A0A9Q4A5S5_PSESX|nr:oxidoreductase [Pseudomonas syringae]MCF5468540.1 SDR family NAD(P)-dependent oxidoreductase [Pseudomonas syringae]MCF5473127.1 SDR family NAD(P)-dependent oxidoreductase [Pseudomonas syringae]MCF5483142.1 SDR family NAD(P)-dependent oxidoreductase [Pseudomonas syringae]MCF5487563.1 SDR family NAD(P)-dependent oxidoreductase [Pseudomonas syringae]MCF5492600.1 SDR family NAD(P)-dependent oxidoreductase [Pseudomonas syringae]